MIVYVLYTSNYSSYGLNSFLQCYANLPLFLKLSSITLLFIILQQDTRNGPPYPQPDNFSGYNMAPPHLVQNPLNNGPFPVGALTRPPPGTFPPPDFPSVASVDAYRQHHEVTAVV
jgi:hypothetical protein